jgi:hypothetical protein
MTPRAQERKRAVVYARADAATEEARNDSTVLRACFDVCDAIARTHASAHRLRHLRPDER